MTSLQITNLSKEKKKEMKLRSQLFFEKKTMKPKLSIDLVVLLFGFIYVYMCISTFDMCNINLTWLRVYFSYKTSHKKVLRWLII